MGDEGEDAVSLDTWRNKKHKTGLSLELGVARDAGVALDLEEGRRLGESGCVSCDVAMSKSGSGAGSESAFSGHRSAIVRRACDTLDVSCTSPGDEWG